MDEKQAREILALVNDPEMYPLLVRYAEQRLEILRVYLENEKNLQNLKAVSTGLEDQLSSINQKIQLAEDLQLKITLLTNELNKQKQVIETNQSSIDAVDSYRIQNNQKVADVLNRLNGLTRDLQAIETELKAIKEEGSNEQSP